MLIYNFEYRSRATLAEVVNDGGGSWRQLYRLGLALNADDEVQGN
jgi:hypothetical protein